MSIFEQICEYRNNYKSIKELKKKKAILKAQQEMIELLAYRIGSMEQNATKPNSAHLLIKEEILDIHNTLSILARDIRANYLQSFNTVEEYKLKHFNDGQLLNHNYALVKKLELSQYIYESYLLSLINVRALFETVKLLMSRIEEPFNNDIYDELSKTIYNTFLKVDKYQNSHMVNLLHQVATAKTFEESWQLYKANRMLLSEFVIIKRNSLKDENWSPVDLLSIFPSSATPNYPIYSFFKNNKVNFLSYRILLSPRNICVNDRNISFDTNIISYFKTWIEKRKASVDLSPILEFLSDPQTQYDYSPFFVENYLSGNYTKEQLVVEIDQIEKDLSSYKLYPYRAGYAEQLVNNFVDLNMVKPIEETYNRIYLTMLVIIWGKLHYSNLPAEKQFQKLCDIMVSEIHDFPLPELAMAYDYYNNSENTVSFFKKIQKNQDALIKNIRNMAWDIFHITFTIRQCLVRLDETNLMIPYFATYDKGLSKILKYYEMEALAICYRTQEYFPYYSISNIPSDVKKKYFNRSITREPINLKMLIDKYEHLIQDI